MIEKERLNFNTVVATVMSNMGLEVALENSGEILIRPSGTEPVTGITVEGENEERINAMAVTMGNHVESVRGSSVCLSSHKGRDTIQFFGVQFIKAVKV